MLAVGKQNTRFHRKQQEATELIEQRMYELKRAQKADGIATFVESQLHQLHEVKKNRCENVADMMKSVQTVLDEHHDLCNQIYHESQHWGQHITEVCPNIQQNVCERA